MVSWWSIWPWKINTIVKKMELLGKQKAIREGAGERAEGVDHQGGDGRTRARPRMSRDGSDGRKCPGTSDAAAGEGLAVRLLCLRHAQFSPDWSVLKSKAAKLPTEASKLPEPKRQSAATFFKHLNKRRARVAERR